MSWQTVAFTGHRRVPGDRTWLRITLRRSVRALTGPRFGTEFFCSGMATGSDLDWAEAVLGEGQRLWAHVPFPEQAEAWPEYERRRRLLLLAEASQVTTYGELGDTRDPARRRHLATKLLHQRNDGMLAVSGALVAAMRAGTTRGGTISAYRKAVGRGMPIIHIDPFAQTITPYPTLEGRLG